MEKSKIHVLFTHPKGLDKDGQQAQGTRSCLSGGQASYKQVCFTFLAAQLTCQFITLQTTSTHSQLENLDLDQEITLAHPSHNRWTFLHKSGRQSRLGKPGRKG